MEKSIGRLVKGNAGNLSPIDGSDGGSFSAYLLQLMYIIRIACVCILRVAELKNSVMIKVLTEIAKNPKRRRCRLVKGLLTFTNRVTFLFCVPSFLFREIL